MQLLLIGVYPLDRQASMPRYVDLLRRGLESRGHTITVMQPTPRFGRLFEDGVLGKWLGYIDKYAVFPLELLFLSARWDCIHICDNSSAIYLRWLPNAAASITCHDVMAIQAAEGKYSLGEVGKKVSWTGRLLQAWIKRNLIRAPKVVCDSAATRQALLSLGATGRIETIHIPLYRKFSRADSSRVREFRMRSTLPVDTPYFLHVGGNQWYKNRVGVIRIFAELKKMPTFRSYHLVLAGKEWTDRVRSACIEENVGDCIHEVVDATDNDIETLYSGADALIFPSLHEGFGWPIIEAQSCATLVITANREPMMEVAGEGAIFIDPLDPRKAASAIADAWPRRENICLCGVRNVEAFDQEHFFDLFESFLFRGRSSEPTRNGREDSGQCAGSSEL
jgi:glycosyltransferase involved in cell wall biosynthesis